MLGYRLCAKCPLSSELSVPICHGLKVTTKDTADLTFIPTILSAAPLVSATGFQRILKRQRKYLYKSGHCLFDNSLKGSILCLHPQVNLRSCWFFSVSTHSQQFPLGTALVVSQKLWQAVLPVSFGSENIQISSLLLFSKDTLVPQDHPTQSMQFCSFYCCGFLHSIPPV